MLIDDSYIVNEVRQDAETGFRLLLDKYQEPVYWHIRRLVVSHSDAQDALQETFIRAFTGLGKLRDSKTLPAWIYRIATNEALRLIERRPDHSATVSLDADDNNAQVLQSQIAAGEYIDYSDLEAVKLQKAIQSLPPKQQAAFTLRYYNEFDYNTIAQIMATSPQNVKANYHAAKEKIIKYIKTNF